MTQYRFSPLRLRDARAIASWHYEGQYAFYDTGLFPVVLVVPLRPLFAAVGVEVYTVRDEDDELVGTFSYLRHGYSVEIGLAMRPDLTGRGLGLDFVRAGMDFAKQRFAPRTFSLDVATFNRRALLVYTRAGFSPVRTFQRRSGRRMMEFMEMTCPAS